MKRVVVVWLLLVAAAGGAYYFYARERQRQADLHSPPAGALEAATEQASQESAPQWAVELHFYRPGAKGSGNQLLVAERRDIPLRETPLRNARQIVQEVLKGPVQKGVRIFPEKGWLRQLYLLENGTAVVDLSQECSQLLSSGITTELAAIRSLTRSLRGNLPEIRAVQFVIEGKRQATLAGHISLLEPFM